MRADYVAEEEMQHLLAALMPQNRLTLEVSMATGLRIGDVLAMQVQKVRESRGRSFDGSGIEDGGRRGGFGCLWELRERMLQQAGKIYVWEGRLDPERHRDAAGGL